MINDTSQALQRDIDVVEHLTVTYYKFTDESTLKYFLNLPASGEVTG